MAKINAGRLIARALKREGVKKVFGLTGGHIMSIFYGCREEGIEVIDVRHECNACFAADSHARVSGIAGVLVTTAGPGITNTVTAMCEAKAMGVPLLQIGGAAPMGQSDTGPLQDMNTFDIMRECSVWARKITNAKRAGEYVAMAFRHAYGPTPGPVYLEIPRDIAFEPFEDDGSALEPVSYRTDAPCFGDLQQVEKAAKVLLEAQRPIFVIGDTSRYNTQYGESVCELAEYLQIPVDTVTPTRGLFADEDEHPLFTIGHYGQKDADALFYFATNLDFRHGRGRPPLINQEATRVYVHPDITKIGYNTRADIGIVGHTGPVCKQLLEIVKAKTSPKKDTEWVKRVNQMAEEGRKGYYEGFAFDTGDGNPIHPGRCAGEVGKFVREEAKDWTLQLDGADAYYWFEQAVRIHRPGQIIHHGPFGTMGSGVGFALGAYFANRKPILHYTGDGSFGFYVMELTSYVKYKVPIVTVISNDSSWGFIRMTQELSNPQETDKGPVSMNLPYMQAYEEIPKIWGGLGFRVNKPSDIIPAIKEVVKTGKPGIVNVEVSRKFMSPFTEAVGKGAPFF